MENEGALEKPSDTGTDGPGVVKRWLREIELADKEERDWREDAKRAFKTYRGENYTGSGDEKRRKDTFNILWSNVETLRPAIYNSPPRPDIRRRFRDEDELGKEIATLMERCASFSIDNDLFEQSMNAAVMDTLLPGRAVTRLRYQPTFSGEGESEEIAFEEVTTEQVQWDDFRHGPGRTWTEVPWISFDHRLTKSEIEKKWGELADKVRYDVGATEDKDDDELKTIYKRCLVHEIWDREKRQIIWVAPSYKDAPLGVDDDPLDLRDFWPIPRPIYSLEDETSLIPVVEYCLYETLARELETVTNRIRRVVDAIRVRGVADSRISELERVFASADNEIIPADNVAVLLEAGGLEKAIWMLPVDTLIQVLQQLYQYRASVIQSIYEATGISDILRGATDPQETLGAQEIKANFGTQRLQRRQREMQRYVRDVLRIMVEIIAEKFSPQTLSLMSGLNYPTMAQKQQAQMVVQSVQAQMMQAQMMLQGAPPEQVEPIQKRLEGQKQKAEQAMAEAQQVLEQPSWEELQEVMRSDLLRAYRIDIETDSTIEAELQDDQKNMVELLEGIMRFFQGIAEPVVAGILPLEAAKKILMAAVRRFKLGSEVEDELDKIQPPPEQPNPDQQKAELEAQKQQAEMQRDQQRFEMEQQEKQMEMAAKEREARLEQERQAMEAERSQQEHAYQMEELRMKAELAREQHQMAMQKARQPKERAA